jgi:intracellular septation protein
MVISPLQVAKPIVLDLLAAIGFAATFFIAKNALHLTGLHSVYAATFAGIAIGFVQLAHKWIVREPIGPLQWLSLGVVLALGTMTVTLHDEHFIKLKPSVIDFAVGLFMATRDWMTPYIPAEVHRDLSERIIFRYEKLWAALMFGFAAANIAVAFIFDFGAWALYATFVPTGIIVALFFAQYFVLRNMAQKNMQARLAAGQPQGPT